MVYNLIYGCRFENNHKKKKNYNLFGNAPWNCRASCKTAVQLVKLTLCLESLCENNKVFLGNSTRKTNRFRTHVRLNLFSRFVVLICIPEYCSHYEEQTPCTSQLINSCYFLYHLRFIFEIPQRYSMSFITKL